MGVRLKILFDLSTLFFIFVKIKLKILIIIIIN